MGNTQTQNRAQCAEIFAFDNSKIETVRIQPKRNSYQDKSTISLKFKYEDAREFKCHSLIYKNVRFLEEFETITHRIKYPYLIYNTLNRDFVILSETFKILQFSIMLDLWLHSSLCSSQDSIDYYFNPNKDSRSLWLQEIIESCTDDIKIETAKLINNQILSNIAKWMHPISLEIYNYL